MNLQTKYNGVINMSSLTFPLYIEYQNRDEFDIVNNNYYSYCAQDFKSSEANFGFIADAANQSVRWSANREADTKKYPILTVTEYKQFVHFYNKCIEEGRFAIIVTEGNIENLLTYMRMYNSRYAEYRSTWILKYEPSEIRHFVGKNIKTCHSYVNSSLEEYQKYNDDFVRITTTDFLHHYQSHLQANIEHQKKSSPSNIPSLPAGKFAVPRTKIVCDYFAERSLNIIYRDVDSKKYFYNINSYDENIFYQGPNRNLDATFYAKSEFQHNNIPIITEEQFIEYIINKTNPTNCKIQESSVSTPFSSEQMKAMSKRLMNEFTPGVEIIDYPNFIAQSNHAHSMEGTQAIMDLLESSIRSKQDSPSTMPPIPLKILQTKFNY